LGEQKIACNTIANSVEGIAQMVEETSVATAQMERSVHGLNELADRMRETVAQFQV
jgi:methyl-accepting chemotaxis protein